jgi:hypothetical protein
MPRLPNLELAIVDIEKLADYCLDPSHPRGRHKARVFRDALGLQQNDAVWFRDRLLEGLLSSDAVEIESDQFGTRWRVDIRIARQDKMAVVRTIWIRRTDERTPRLVSCWVL